MIKKNNKQSKPAQTRGNESKMKLVLVDLSGFSPLFSAEYPQHTDDVITVQEDFAVQSNYTQTNIEEHKAFKHLLL